MQPLAKRCGALSPQNAAEAHGKPAHDGEFRRCCLERVNGRRLPLGQQWPGFDTKRRGSEWREWATGRRIPRKRRDRSGRLLRFATFVGPAATVAVTMNIGPLVL